MDEEILEQVEKINNEKLWEINYKASKQMKRLGIACLSLILLDILIATFVTRFSLPMIFSITVCSLTAVFDFYKSKSFAKEAHKYKGDCEYD